MMEYVVADIPPRMLANLLEDPVLGDVFRHVSAERYARMSECLLSMLYGRRAACPWLACMQRAHRGVSMTPEAVAAWKRCFRKTLDDLGVTRSLRQYASTIEAFVDDMVEEDDEDADVMGRSLDWHSMATCTPDRGRDRPSREFSGIIRRNRARIPEDVLDELTSLERRMSREEQRRRASLDDRAPCDDRLRRLRRSSCDLPPAHPTPLRSR